MGYRMTTLYWKLIGGGIAVILIGVFIASWLARGAEIERLSEWQSTVVQATTLATVEPDSKGRRAALDPSQVPAAIAALRRTADNATSQLEAIDQASLRDQALQRRLDEQLAAILDSQDRSAEGTRARLNDLLTRQATGDREQDCAIMENDSNAPWDGWRK